MSCLKLKCENSNIGSHESQNVAENQSEQYERSRIEPSNPDHYGHYRLTDKYIGSSKRMSCGGE